MRLWPFHRGIAEAIEDQKIERVTLVKPVRVGFSTLLHAAVVEAAPPAPGTMPNLAARPNGRGSSQRSWAMRVIRTAQIRQFAGLSTRLTGFNDARRALLERPGDQREWRKIPGRANEALDIVVGARALAWQLKIG